MTMPRRTRQKPSTGVGNSGRPSITWRSYLGEVWGRSTSPSKANPFPNEVSFMKSRLEKFTPFIGSLEDNPSMQNNWDHLVELRLDPFPEVLPMMREVEKLHFQEYIRDFKRVIMGYKEHHVQILKKALHHAEWHPRLLHHQNRHTFTIGPSVWQRKVIIRYSR